MSIDKSLKSRSVLSRHRSVLTRAERVARLEADERWTEEDDVFGLPKVRNLRAKRTKLKQETTAAEAEAAAPAEAVTTEAGTEGPEAESK